MAKGKPHMNIVFVGHVDHGKSTSVGRLLYDAGAVDEQTMRIHHTKHHKSYVDNLNLALKNHEELHAKIPEELVKELNSISEEIRISVKNNAGGHLNHSFFWTILKKGTKADGEILNAIKKDFGSYENFVQLLKNSAVTQFGSGWAWLVLNPRGKKLEIMQTHDQESPISLGKIPLLVIDVWEHAYYIKYQNRRLEYVDAFMNVINWNKVNENYMKALEK